MFAKTTFNHFAIAFNIHSLTLAEILIFNTWGEDLSGRIYNTENILVLVKPTHNYMVSCKNSFAFFQTSISYAHIFHYISQMISIFGIF